MNQEPIDQAAAWMEEDGKAFAAKALQRALGSHALAVGILCSAVGFIFDQMDPKEREILMEDFLDTFRP